MDVTNAIDAGQAGSPDRVQLEHATADGRVLFTYNVGDFFALHTQFRQDGRSHAGLILAVQQRYTVGEQMRRILRINRERSSNDMRRSEEHTSELQSLRHLVCRLLLEKKNERKGYERRPEET